MNSEIPVIPPVILIAVCAVILYFVIEAATRSKAIRREMKIQTDLLSKIAEKQGATSKEINDIFIDHNPLLKKEQNRS